MFWHDGQNQKAFHLVWKRAKNLSATFFRKRCRDGFTSVSMIPTIRGRFLRWSVRFMAYTREHLTLEPDFTGTALDGELHFKGRIALYIRSGQQQRLFISKDFRRLLRFLRKRDSDEKA